MNAMRGEKRNKEGKDQVADSIKLDGKEIVEMKR
jgi:hypothetical protein